MRRLLPALLLLAALPADAARIAVDHDTDYDFSVPRTVAWGDRGTDAPSELTQRRIERAIERELGEAGLELVQGEADLKVITHAAANEARRKSTVRVVVGLSRSTGWGGIGVGGSGAVGGKEVHEGTLLVQLIDTASGYLVWEGRARETFDADADAEQVEAKVNAAVKRLFKKYPPKPKRKKKRGQQP